MNVVHINSERHWGGGETQTYYLIQGLRDQGIENTLVAQPNSPLAAKASKDGITVKEIPMKGEWDIIAILKIRQLLRTMQPDILHLHTAHAHTIGLAAGKLAKVKKIIVTRRTTFPTNRLLSRIKYSIVDKFAAISESVKQTLIAGGVHEGKVTVIHSAVHCQRPSPESGLRKQLDPTLQCQFLGTVGNLVEAKGHKYLLEAMPKIKQKFPKTKLLLAGEGPLEKKLRDLARQLNLDNEVIFLGFKKDISHVLSTLDVFVMPSLQEGLGVSLLEASACKIPIVATETGGIPEVVRNDITGLLVAPRDSKALAEKIIYMLAHGPEAKKMAQNANKLVLENFSLEKMLDGYLKLYESV